MTYSMVHTAGKIAAECVVCDMTPCTSGKKEIIVVHPTTTVSFLLAEVSKRYSYEIDKFELILQSKVGNDTTINLNEIPDQTCEEAGINFEFQARNSLVLCSSYKHTSTRKSAMTVPNCDGPEEDLLLGASASPTAASSAPISGTSHEALPPPGMLYSAGDYEDSSAPLIDSRIIRLDLVGYVGLVNQAMTCYLNSLIQALYMTPEFRNALYNWEFDGSDEVKSIPYQLQRLFLNLQTSTKKAVETKDLTKSFGWDSSEAWQQHDIQELCRVMFDALEQKFKKTKQADLINRLYEGKMIDYVKCLECSTEKQREDTFLDIPLPVRPFGSAVAYGSVEEALRAFVQPETLDGNNQYFCEKCNKKCDAHKGLKFSKFPYLLTLHLKRFDFDYSTLHRIKLNDKVVFPATLNLNSFITTSGSAEETESEEAMVTVKCDDCSTTDSGSALDEDSCQGTDTTATSTVHDIDYQDDDEGIDVTSGPNQHENEKNRNHSSETGPYMYELFSIMIHSGSATGGHYYAFIKDFKTSEWFCFNDQTVSTITYDDIRKTYGGGPARGYYSSTFSSSTNAYMLMYRQIDSQRNAEAMGVDSFPPHIKRLLDKMREAEENDRVIQETELRRCQLKVYAHHPTRDLLLETKLTVFKDTKLAEATKEARSRLGLDDLVPLECCRLVCYEHMQDVIECSFEGREHDEMGDILASLKYNYKHDFLLEIRKENEDFEVYQPGGLYLKIYLVDVEKEVVDGPVVIRGNQSQTVGEYKETVANVLDIDPSVMKLVIEKYSDVPYPLEFDDRTLKQEGIYSSSKLYAAKMYDEDQNKPFLCSKLHDIIEQFEHVISLQIILPEVDKETLETLCIPALDVNHNSNKTTEEQDAVMTPSPPQPSAATNSPVMRRASPLATEIGSDQSNSEDSSLSDSDRTLVGEVVDEEGLAQISVSSMSPCVSSPEDTNKLEENWDEFPHGQSALTSKKPIHYFKATELTTENKQNRKTRVLKTLIDKRMNLYQLKRDLEPYVGVPMDYFKVYRYYYTAQEQECTRLRDNFKTYSDQEKIGIKLGRALKNGEYSGKVFHLMPNDREPVQFLCDWIIAKGATIGEVKKSLLEDLRRKGLLDISYERCRLRKKSWKMPGKVYLDHYKFDKEVMFHSNWDIFIQELNEPEVVTSNDQIILFVRHWCPSTLELKPFKEIVLENVSVDEFKRKISMLSGIPVEHLDICKAKGTFPHETSVLGLHNDPEWNANFGAIDKWSIFDDGNVYFYRDNREELKQLTTEERKELTHKESARMNRVSGSSASASTYSPRRERGLKIYLDSPNRDEDVD